MEWLLRMEKAVLRVSLQVVNWGYYFCTIIIGSQQIFIRAYTEPVLMRGMH